MAQNRTRKTMRHFQCRDDLWGLFEKMAVELECSVDYLINEAMRQYARTRKYSNPQLGRDSAMPPELPPVHGGIAGPPPMPQMQAAPPPGGIRPIAPQPMGQRMTAPPPLRQQVPVQQAAMQMQQPPAVFPPPAAMQMPPRVAAPPSFQTSPPPSAARTQGMTMPMGRPPAPQAAPMPPSPMTSPFMPAAAGTIPTLYLIFNGQRIPITKEQFIIGRGLKTSDLAIKDGNISRKHSAIIFHNGAYYIKDLGSVNGIEFGGKRIDSKRIDEGDVFHICDYELRFTYR